MIKLVLKFEGKENQKFDIVDGERLNDAVRRSIDGVPLGKFSADETFQVVVNGHAVEAEFWPTIGLKEYDVVIISPKLKSGDAGTIFKTAALIVITVITAIYAPYLIGEEYPVLSALFVAGVTIGASMLLNALIPPPVANLGDLGEFGGGLADSQMYSIGGQSNQVRRYDTVPKVYGQFRMFPTIAATPYTELSVSPGDKAYRVALNIVYTAIAYGSDGNNITVVYQDGAPSGGSETVVADVKRDKTTLKISSAKITVTICAGASTANQILAAVNANTDAAAIVSLVIKGDGTTIQPLSDMLTKDADTYALGGGANGGETVQYLVALYDFGLGTNIINGMQIGDTPLTTDSFSDFNFNFVDPNVPAIPADIYDQGLKSDFQYYRGSREITTLAIALNNINDENTQNSDANGDLQPQEIILDFVCPKGLYSYSSFGALGRRYIVLEVEFAPIGSTNWQAYNDLNYVSSSEVIGGDDQTNSYTASFYPTIENHTGTPAGKDTWYSFGVEYNFLWFNDSVVDTYVRPNTDTILLTNGVYQVGSKVFYGNRLLGIIKSVDTVVHAPAVAVQLDRIITKYERDVKAYEWSSGATGGFNFVCGVRIDSNASGAATIRGSSTSPVYASVRFSPKTPGQYQVRIRRAGSDGDYTSQIADALTLGGLTTAYTKAPINTKLRHTFMELRIRATNQLNGNISNLSAITTSVLNVYDPNTKTMSRDITANPAWVFLDLLIGEVNKLAIDQSKVDFDSIVEWAAFCDEIPTPPFGQTYTLPRFQCNMVLDYQTNLQDVMAQIGGAAQASMNVIGGKYGVLIDKDRTTPVQIFTPRNSSKFSSTKLYGVKPDGIDVTWIDPTADWAQADVTVYDDGFTADNAVNVQTLASFACTNHEQAWRFGRYMLAQNRLRQETISIQVDFEFLACTRGDYVQITQDVMEVGGTPMRVKSLVGNVITTDDAIDYDPSLNYGYVTRGQNGTVSTSTLTASSPDTFTLDGILPNVGDLIVIGVMGEIVYDCIVKSISPNNDLSATISLVEQASAIYDAESTSSLPDYTPDLSVTSLGDVKPPLPVTNLVVTDIGWDCSSTRQGLEYFVALQWTIPANSVYELFEIWVNDGTGYKSIATTKIKTYKYEVDPTRLGINHGFKVLAVSATGKKIDLIGAIEVTANPTLKDTLPPDITALHMSITNQVLQLSWDSIGDCSAFQYVLRYSPSEDDIWESSVPLAIVPANSTSVSVQARTGIYFIKVLDTEGNLSANACEAITTIPDLIDVNDIETIDDIPGLSGEFDSTETLGEAVILSEQVHGDPNTVIYFDEGFYTFGEVFDLGDIYSVRLLSLIRADGYRKGELMSDWVELDMVDHLNTTLHSDWDISLQYRASNTFEAMSDWVELAFIDHLNSGAGIGFTDWRDIPTTGDATGRVFQFRAHLQSLTDNVTPRLFDATVQAVMPDRLESFEGLTSSSSLATQVVYGTSFYGPGNTPNVQVSIANAQSGDYWSFDSKTLAGCAIRFYDKSNTQVVRSFDLVAKGYGNQHTTTL